jgi:hypothetical protein
VGGVGEEEVMKKRDIKHLTNNSAGTAVRAGYEYGGGFFG